MLTEHVTSAVEIIYQHLESLFKLNPASNIRIHLATYIVTIIDIECQRLFISDLLSFQLVKVRHVCFSTLQKSSTPQKSPQRQVGKQLHTFELYQTKQNQPQSSKIVVEVPSSNSEHLVRDTLLSVGPFGCSPDSEPVKAGDTRSPTLAALSGSWDVWSTVDTTASLFCLRPLH
jgi:hypothetical protein